MGGMIDPSFRMPKPPKPTATATTPQPAPASTPQRDIPIYGPNGIERFAPAQNPTQHTYSIEPPPPTRPSMNGLYNAAANPNYAEANPLNNGLAPYLPSAGGGGQGLRQPSYEDQELERLRQKGEREDLERRAQLNREEFDRRLGVLSPPNTGSGGGTGFDPNASRAAHDAIFARAKDKAGQIARASTDTIKNVLGERGLLGGGYEADAYEGIVSAAQGELGEVNRDLMIDDLDRLYEVEDLNRSDATIRRGQDLGVRNSLLGLMNTSLY